MLVVAKSDSRRKNELLNLLMDELNHAGAPEVFNSKLFFNL